MNHNYSQYSMEELREISSDVNREIDLRKHQLRDRRFDAMMQAIQEFKEVCPCAKVCDYEYSVYINYIADRDNWEFGE